MDESFPELAPRLRARGLSLDAVIHQSDVFDLIEDEPLDNWLGDMDAMKERIAAAAAIIEDKCRLTTAMGVMRLAAGVQQELDAAFGHVTGLPARGTIAQAA